MSKKLFAFVTVAMVMVFGTFALFAANVSQKPVVKAKKMTTSKPSVSMIRSNGNGAEMAAAPLFSDDFEGTQDSWWPDASWNNTDSPHAGKVFSQSTWEYTDAESHSASHSWHNLTNVNQHLDFLFSPVFHVPTQVTIDGITSELKGGFINFMAKMDSTNGAVLRIYVSDATPLWKVTDDDPHSGAKNYNMTQPDVPQIRQWLISPQIDLSAATAPKLMFWHNYISELEWDYLAVDASTDSFQTYTNLAVYSGKQEAYVADTLDLSAFAGKKIWFRFRYTSDEGFTEKNAHWDVDDILVADSTDTIFYDGAEGSASAFTMAGFGGGDPSGIAAINTPIGDWTKVDLGNVLLKGAKPGTDVRMAFQWSTAGRSVDGTGIYIDDVNVIPMGKQHVDVEAVGVAGLTQAALGHVLSPSVVIANVGLDTLNGRISWLGKIYKHTLSKAGEDSMYVVANLVGVQQMQGFAPDQTIRVEALENTRWTPMEPGDYTMGVDVILNSDTYKANNSVKVDFEVLGPPFAIPIYKEDFEPRAGEKSLEDFGWTVKNKTDHGWIYDSWIYGMGPSLSGYFYGWTGDSASAAMPIDACIKSPEIDISKVNPHNVIFMNCYIYFRPGHGGLPAPWGTQKSDISVEYSVDGGAWQQAFYWADDDTLPGDINRWPQTPKGIPYWQKTDLILPNAAGGEKLQVRVHFTSENSYVFGINFDEVVIYQGLINPVLGDVKDVPNDNGKQVALAWRASWNDLNKVPGVSLQNPVTHYNVWRGRPVGGGAEATHFSTTKEMLRNAADFKVGQQVIADDHHMLWVYMGSVPAMGWKYYGYVAPTTADSLETAFMVSAHTANPNIYDVSNVSKGMSIDNLAPHVPGGLTGAQADFHAVIGWEPVPDEDLMFYTVYRKDANGNWVQIARTTDNSYVDKNVTLEKTYTYAVSATDFAWNESAKSKELPIFVTSVDGKVSNAVPTDYALNQNYPNPFNPTTEIRYAIPKSANVTISIYNVFGQKVRTLVAGHKLAGYYVATWDGRADNGREVSSGIYFYEIHAGKFTATKKMTLMR